MVVRIAARMAVELAGASRGSDNCARSRTCSPARNQSYGGINVIVRALSAHGFTAEIRGEIAEGSFVRLKLPCMGTMLARISWSRSGQVGGEFLNAVNPLRLQQVLGFSAQRAIAQGLNMPEPTVRL